MARWMSLGALLCLSVTGCTLEPLRDTAYSLTDDVSLHRDEFGVVHVYGSTDADVYYGSGYAQARDRLFQMDFMRRRALGRRAEVAGESYVEDDRLVRMMGIGESGAATAEQLKREDPETFALLEAWTAGINAYIDEVNAGVAPMPIGFSELGTTPERWAVSDGLTVGKLVLFGNANQIEFELLSSLLRQYVPEVWQTLPLLASLESAYVLPELERPRGGGDVPRAAGPKTEAVGGWPQGSAPAMQRFAARWARWRPGASNNWAVSGEHTENGRSLIAGDPHQPLRSPSVFWLHHLNSSDAGGTLDVAGFSFAGSPGIQLGHNRAVAWTATTSYPDVMDLVDVDFDGTRVTVGGEVVDAEVRRETIDVKDGDPVDVEVVVVPGYGRLLPEGLSPLPLGSGRLMVRWTGFGPTREALGFIKMGAATDLEAYGDAVDGIEIGNFNFIAATADAITYRSGMVVPDRGTFDATQPPFALLDGAKAEPWSQLSPDLLPQSAGAGRGYLVSANNDPYGFTADGSVEGDPFYFGVFFDPGTRAARSESELQRLISGGDVTVEQMQELQLDTHSRFADHLLPVLQEVFASVGTDPDLEAYENRSDLAALANRLAAWDRRMDADSADALVFHALLWFATSRTLRDDLSLAFTAIEEASPVYVLKWAMLTLTRAYPDADALMQEGRSPIIMAALADTAAFLEERFGGIDAERYRWGDMHETHFRDLGVAAYDGPRFPSGGADGTVNVADGSLFGGGEDPADMITTTSGPAYRMVADFAEDGRPQAWINFAPGNPGEPGEPLADANLPDWRDGQYRRLPFTEAEVTAATLESLTLSP